MVVWGHKSTYKAKVFALHSAVLYTKRLKVHEMTAIYSEGKRFSPNLVVRVCLATIPYSKGTTFLGEILVCHLLLILT